jgi:hypothetical protein
MSEGIIQAIMENAQRLREDATVLLQAKRYASCVLLQIFCLEELGKALLLDREIARRKGPGYHQQKQEAGLSLAIAHITARLLLERSSELGIDFDGDTEATNAHWIEGPGKTELRAALREPSAWLNQARKGTLRKLRDITAYIDSEADPMTESLLPNITYRSCDEPFCKFLFSFIDDAFGCLESPPEMGLAKLWLTEIGFGSIEVSSNRHRQTSAIVPR